MRELSCQLPQDLRGRLDKDAKRPGAGSGARSAARLYQDMRVLHFMVYWEHELRTGADRYGQPEHYQLPDQGETANDRAALKLLRACCSDDFRAEKTVLAFLNAAPDIQEPILKSMQSLLAGARKAAADAVLFEGSPPAGEDVPTTRPAKAVAKATALSDPLGETEPPEGAHDAIPFTSPLSAPDLARLLRERGFDRATDDAVGAFLKRCRDQYDDCYIPLNNDDRLRNTAKYLYRPVVWPWLVEHFSRRRSV